MDLGEEGDAICHEVPRLLASVVMVPGGSAGALWASVAFVEGYPVSPLVALALVGPKLCNCFQHWKVGLE